MNVTAKDNIFHLIIITLLSVCVLLIGSQFLWTGHLHSSALGQSMNDQPGYITTARNIAENGEYESSVYYPAKMPYKSHNLTYMPGNYYIRAVFFSLFGYSIFTAFLPNLLAFIGSVILLFLTATRLFDRKIAYKAVILFMVFPPFVLYSFSAMQEMVFVFACLLSFYVFISLPQKTRYIFGGLTLLTPFFIKEVAVFMVPGFAMMIFSGYRQRRFQKTFVFLVVSVIMMFLILSLPVVSDRSSTFYARLVSSGASHYSDAYVLENVRLMTYSDMAKLIWFHFWENIMIFKALFTSPHWAMDFTFFLIVLFSFLVCAVLLFLNKPINRVFAFFIVVSSFTICAAMFFMYEFHNYQGLRLLLFIVPFSICVIVHALFTSKLLMKRTYAIVTFALICIVSIYSFWSSLHRFHNDFIEADVYDQECANFLDSLGVSNAKFFVAPFYISLDYVNRHYPIKWSFVPDNEETLRLLTDKYPIDLIIIPLYHNLVYDTKQHKTRDKLLEGKFKLSGVQVFLNEVYLIFKPNHYQTS